jgi:hypothetical protein
VVLNNFQEAVPDAQVCVAPQGDSRKARTVRATRR